MASMQLQATCIFIVMDQTSLFKETYIFLTRLLLLCVTVTHRFHGTGFFSSPSFFAASCSWGPLASCIPQLGTLSFLQWFELIYLGFVTLFLLTACLNPPLSTPPNLFIQVLVPWETPFFPVSLLAYSSESCYLSKVSVSGFLTHPSPPHTALSADIPTALLTC